MYVDVEHSSFSLDSTSQICIACLNAGITPLVRIASFAPDIISRILDGGALGIIAPHVHSADDASRVVRAAKFPPFGDRSFSAALPHFQYRPIPAAEYFAALNDATSVVVMIESAEGLAKVDEIAAVEGVDMLFIGTNDLCASLGIRVNSIIRRSADAYERALTACRRHGKHLGVGGLAGQPALVAEFVKLGGRYVSTGTDLSFLLSAATAKVKQLRGT